MQLPKASDFDGGCLVLLSRRKLNPFDRGLTLSLSVGEEGKVFFTVFSKQPGTC